MEYRNDLEAARMRIETLEAKLAEREASLRARDAEIAEQERQLVRLHPNTTGAKKPFPVALFAFIVFGVALLGAALTTVFLIRAPAPRPPPATDPSVVENGPMATGKTHVEPVAPTPTLPHVEGAAPAAEPSPPPTEVLGKITPDESDTLADQVEKTKDSTRRLVRACHKDERASHPSATGFVNVVFEIEPTGKVTSVKLQGLFATAEPWWSKAFEACVVRGYKGLAFKPFQGAKTAAKDSYHLGTNDLGI